MLTSNITFIFCVVARFCACFILHCNVCKLVSFYWSRVCISRFKDCPLCGADFEKIEANTDLQSVVDQFIDGHARIRRSHVDMDKEGEAGENKKVTYEDVSLERGAFLVQQAMRVSIAVILPLLNFYPPFGRRSFRSPSLV